MAREDEIRLIAYKIWEQEGCSGGHDCEHWYRAETIWENQQKDKQVAASTRTEARPVKQIAKGTAARKQSRKPRH